MTIIVFRNTLLLILGLCFFSHFSNAQPVYSPTDLVISFAPSIPNSAIDSYLTTIGGTTVDFYKNPHLHIRQVKFNLDAHPLGFTNIEEVNDYLECNGGFNGVDHEIRLRAVDYNYTLNINPSLSSTNRYNYNYYNPYPNCPNYFTPSTCMISPNQRINIGFVDSGHESGTDWDKIMSQDNYDFVHQDVIANDETGHGTNVESTVGGILASYKQNVSFMAIKALDVNNESSLYLICKAITYGIDKNNDLINLSVSGLISNTDLCTSIFDEVMNFAEDEDVLVIGAAGNDELDIDRNPSFPSYCTNDNLLIVSSSDCNNRLSNFSNFGRNTTDLSTPGEDVAVYQNVLADGTSFSTSITTGIAGLIALKYPSLNAKRIKRKIMEGVDDYGLISQTGGVLNPAKALNCSSTQNSLDFRRINTPSDTPLALNSLEAFFSNNDELSIRLMSSINSSAQVRIFSMSGQTLNALTIHLIKGSNQHRLRGFSDLPKGVYIIQAKTGEVEMTQKCIKW